MTEVMDRPAEESALLDAYALAHREAREAWRELRGAKRALDHEARAARAAGEQLPDWHVRAATEIIYRADQAFTVAQADETAALRNLSRYMDRKLAAGVLPAALPSVQVTQ